MDSNQTEAAAPEGTKPPFLYEIKVKGRLSPEQWTSWFDDLTVSFRNGETLLRGKAPDHAALYGLLARLRDLAVPLVSVKVLDAEAQRRLAEQYRLNDRLAALLLIGVYLAILGALVTLTVFAAQAMHTGLALALFFAALGGLARGLERWTGLRVWRWLGYAAWAASAVCFVLFVALSLLPGPLGIGLVLVLVAAVLLYAVAHLRRRTAGIDALLPEQQWGAHQEITGAEEEKGRRLEARSTTQTDEGDATAAHGQE